MQCLDCGAGLIPIAPWRAATTEQKAAWTAAGMRQHRTRSLCGPCDYKRRQTGVRMPPRLRVELAGSRECTGCSVTLVSSSRWAKFSPAVRLRLRRMGAAPHAGKHQCWPCRYTGGRRQWPVWLLIDEAEHLLDAGESQERVAERLGLLPRSLAKAFERGRKRGLTTRRMPYGPQLRRTA